MKTLEYRRPVEALTTGSSLGNLQAFARLDERSDLLGLWSAADNRYYVGSWAMRVVVDGEHAQAKETIFRPESQSTRFVCGPVQTDQTFFLPILSGSKSDEALQRSAIAEVQLSNTGRQAAAVALEHRLVVPAVATAKFSKQPDPAEQQRTFSVVADEGICIASTVGAPAECRVFGSSIPWETLHSDATSFTVGYRIDLAPGEIRTIAFRLTFSPFGKQEAIAAFHALADFGRIHEATIATMHAVLSKTLIMTPDPLVNRGIAWAKVNMLRVRHRFRAGEAFTNDPPQDIVVMRDLAWYTLGMDALNPQSSRAMLELVCARAIHDGGKVTEFIHADEASPALHDYDLNINDDTPLVLWALAHHGWAVGDLEFFRRVYPFMKKSAEWILAQRVDGLVTCTAAGTNVWGICGWRNIIDRYTLSGAVTEINSECFLALQLTSSVARDLGLQDDAQRFSEAALALQHEMHARLRSGRSGFFLLNIDREGLAHHDVTGDLIFPVLTGVADRDLREKILTRLTEPDFWTEFGARTVPPGEWNFDPDADYQLRGGVWPNLTAWIAYSLRAFRPSMVAEGLRAIYRVSERERPAQFGALVPGEFPERLNGLDYRSRGMALSPWTPPTYFWLAVEGLLGLRCSLAEIEIDPALPSDWGWLAVTNLPVHGIDLNVLLCDGLLYCTAPVKSRLPVRVGRDLPAHSDSAELFVVAFEFEREIVVFAAGPAYFRGNVWFEHHGAPSRVECNLGSAGSALLRIRQTDIRH